MKIPQAVSLVFLFSFSQSPCWSCVCFPYRFWDIYLVLWTGTATTSLKVLVFFQTSSWPWGRQIFLRTEKTPPLGVHCFPGCSASSSFISPCYSLELCIELGISVPFSFVFHFFSQLFVRLPQTTTLPSCISFSWGWFWSLPPVQCYKPPFIVLQALSTRFNPLNLFITFTVKS